MAKPNPTDCAQRDPSCPRLEDTKVERAVMAYLLQEHIVLELLNPEYPSRLTIIELSLALNERPGDFGSEDAVERAVRELVGAGLLECIGGRVEPTRAARYYSRLDVL